MYDNLGRYVSSLEEQGELIRIKTYVSSDGEIAEQRGFYMQAVAVYGFKRFSARYEICLFVLPRQSAADQTAYSAYPKNRYFHLRVLQSFCCQAVAALIINRCG